jgi:hypothetical protein
VITLTRRTWSMPALSLLLVLPPLVVFILNNAFNVAFGDPAGYFPQPWLQNGAAEAAGRIKTIAAFLLFGGMSIGLLVVWLGSFRILDRRSAILVLAVYLLTVGFGSVVVDRAGVLRGTPYLDQAFACASFNHLDSVAQGQSSIGAAHPRPSARAQPLPPDLAPVEDCPASQFRLLHMMIRILGGLLLFGMPAVIFGAVTCLAAPAAGSTVERMEAWTLQTRRLNGFLYLAATYMISGILFTNAQLSWIGYSLHPEDLGPYRDYVGAIMLHAGIANSLLIASYYLPVALWLAATRPSQPHPAAVKGQAPRADAPDPFGPLRIGGAILAPALVGFLGELLKL